jgi:hypothetical protein
LLAASRFLNFLLHGIIAEDERGLTAPPFRTKIQDSAAGAVSPALRRVRWADFESDSDDKLIASRGGWPR